MSFSYVGSRPQVFFNSISPLGINNWTGLEEDIARIYERLMIVDIWHDADSMAILTEKMRHLRIIKHRRSISLSVECEKSCMVDRTIDFIEITTVHERPIFFCTIM